jgi:hypothetical protein
MDETIASLENDIAFLIITIITHRKAKDFKERKAIVSNGKHLFWLNIPCSLNYWYKPKQTKDLTKLIVLLLVSSRLNIQFFYSGCLGWRYCCSALCFASITYLQFNMC